LKKIIQLYLCDADLVGFGDHVAFRTFTSGPCALEVRFYAASSALCSSNSRYWELSCADADTDADADADAVLLYLQYITSTASFFFIFHIFIV